MLTYAQTEQRLVTILKLENLEKTDVDHDIHRPPTFAP